MTTLYGTSESRAARSIVALEELVVPYEHVPLISRPGTGDRRVLERINPNAQIPVLGNDGLIVWESIAINLYLGDKHGGPLWPILLRTRAPGTDGRRAARLNAAWPRSRASEARSS